MMTSKEKLCEIILSPLVTEKAYAASQGDKRQVFFKVKKQATKSEIKESIEFLFDVKVEAVNTSVKKGKTRMFKQMPGKASDWKKAMVTLKSGYDINSLSEK